MALNNHPEPRQSKACAAVAGGRQLMPGQAISLWPREAGVLRIASGQVWVTVNGPHTGHGNESGDHFLKAGQVLVVGGGQQLVLEPWDAACALPVYFDWTLGAINRPVSVTNWQVAVVQPAQDLGQALYAAGRALGQLLVGLARYGERMVAVRQPAQRAAAAEMNATSSKDRAEPNPLF